MTDPTNLDAPVTTADLALSVQMLSHVLNGALGPMLAPNPETILGNHPTAQPVEDCAGCGRAPQQAHTYFCVECEAAAIASHRAVRESEPDGPIREPGDDVEVLSDSDMVEWLTERATKARDGGKYGTAHAHEMAATRIEVKAELLDEARATITAHEATIARLVKELAAAAVKP